MFSNLRKSRFLVLLWMTFFSAFALSENSFKAFAQSAAVEARVTSVSGAATLSGNGRNGAKLTRGTILAPGHEIDTRGGGRVVIDLSDGSQVIVMPGSRLVFGDYRNSNSLRELLQITLGRIRVKINHFKNKPNPYRIKSPTASIAVRGTEFEVTVESLGETRVIVSEGAVEVASLRDLQNSLLAEPGRSVVVRPDFTLDFFVSGLTTNDAGKRGRRQDANANDQNNSGIDVNSQAANVYERFIENVAQTGETIAPAHFNAFADRHLDSLENPAYAAAFTRSEGRVYFAPSFSDAGDENDALDTVNPVDYAVGLRGTIFAPLNRFRLVVGASGSFVANGLQSFNENSDILLDNSPFTVDETGVRSKLSTSNNKFFDGSLIVARKLGSRDQTSIGLSYERFTSNGNLSRDFNQTDTNDPATIESTTSAFRVNRRRVTFGLKHDFGKVNFGAFYRYGRNATGVGESSGNFNNLLRDSLHTDSKSVSSEIGFRLRGAFSRRLFYGAEAGLLFSRSREELQLEEMGREEFFESKQRSAINRQTISFGLGYFWRPRTIFSFDVSGGFININRNRSENSTGNTLETGRVRAGFLSAHAAVQTDVWRSLFASASIVSINQSRSTDSALFPDRFGRRLNAVGVFIQDGRTRDFASDFYSNYGIGWRFTQDFIFQYILTTDYGKSAPRHAFNFRYTFDFSRK